MADMQFDADGARVQITSGDAVIMSMSLEELANRADMAPDGIVLLFSYQPTLPADSTFDPRQYRRQHRQIQIKGMSP